MPPLSLLLMTRYLVSPIFSRALVIARNWSMSWVGWYLLNQSMSMRMYLVNLPNPTPISLVSSKNKRTSSPDDSGCSVLVSQSGLSWLSASIYPKLLWRNSLGSCVARSNAGVFGDNFICDSPRWSHQ